MGVSDPPRAMEPVPRKRKGAPSACSAARSLQDLASRKLAVPRGRPTAIPPRRRGLKQKVGCIDSTTRIGRRKWLQSEYDLGEEIGHGNFGSVRAKAVRAALALAYLLTVAELYTSTASLTAKWRYSHPCPAEASPRRRCWPSVLGSGEPCRVLAHGSVEHGLLAALTSLPVGSSSLLPAS